MQINKGDKVKITFKKRKIENGKVVLRENGLPIVEEEVFEGVVSGIIEENWLCVYNVSTDHIVIDKMIGNND